MDLFDEVVALTSALDKAAVDYAICGGVALAIHGAARATRDIDVLARAADLERLRDVARDCGFTIEALPMDFATTGVSIRRFTKLTPPGRSLMLDVVLADGPIAAVWDTRTRVAFAGPSGPSSLWVVSREGLITLKLVAGRPQDLVDVQRLQEVSHGSDDS